LSASKLTTIVAVDVAGYSALAQSDEAAAVAAVARLQERCAASAAQHNGRIFNTAGDAVMMEFASVAAGIYAAAELAAHPDPPIRVGVHLGEVTTLPSGDLLGHGVNVAARLQAQARPGHVLVSEDARRALRGPLAQRLAPKGVIKLDKIDENIAIYELDAEEHAGGRIDGRQRNARRLRFLTIGGVGLAVVLAIALLVWPLLNREPEIRVAVFTPTAESNADLSALTTGVADDISVALTAMNVDAIARAETGDSTRERRLERARELGAALALEGAAETQRGSVRLTINIVRTSDRITLWSNVFEGRATELAGLRQRAAERSADVLSCGVRVVRLRGAEIKSDVFSLLLRGCELFRRPDRQLEMRDIMAQVVAREPDFDYALALSALAGAVASQNAPDALREELRARARNEAERALRIDRSIGESYIALSLVEAPENYDVREHLLRRGLERDETNATLISFYAALLDEVGRTGEALAFARRSSTLDPLSTSKRRAVANMLLMTGDADEARDIVESMAAAYSGDATHWSARARVAFLSGDYARATALLSDPASLARTPRARGCWRQAFDALQRQAATASDLLNIRTCAESGDLPAPEAVQMLSALGDLDGAFALARTTFVDEGSAGQVVLFSSATARMRADPRFMQLARDMGLVRYWRLSGRWPDFCADDELPYECRAEARRR